LGLLALLLAARHLPADRPLAQAERVRFDHLGTLLLALTLAAYALAMTVGRGSFGLLNALLLVAAGLGVGLFLRVESTAASPLIRLVMFCDSTLGASFAMSALVMTVMMATLVVGPFYLSAALGLDAAQVGLAMSSGPIVSALTGVPAGRIVDRFGAPRMRITGLGIMAAGALILPVLPMSLGALGYVAPLIVLTAGYALFQAANNTAVMADVHPDQRGVVSGLLNLSRNLGLITGAAVMGSVFAFGAATSDISTAQPEAVAVGMHATFAVAALLIVIALAIAIASYILARRIAATTAGQEQGRSAG
jgi:MFS family permease